MKTLLYITNGIHGAGGLERVLSIKAGFLAEQLNYKVHVLVLNKPNENPFYDFSDRITIHNVIAGGHAIKYVKEYVRGILHVVKKCQPDMISVCDDGLKGFFLPLLIKRNCPIIYERHVSKAIALGPNSTIIQRLKVNITYWLMNMLAKNFDKFVVLTPDNKREWRLNNLAIIANPLSFYPASSSDLQNKKVIAVGKQSYQKGFDLLLQSWKIAAVKFPDWQLHIYGKFDPNQRLEAQVYDFGLDGKVFFHQPEPNIKDKYLESSIFAFSSRFEGFGMVLIEAMACGVPCVSFDCPYGPADIIADGEDGFLVQNGNIELFADKLILLMDDMAVRKQLGINARKNVQRYLPEIIIPQWDQLFRGMIK